MEDRERPKSFSIYAKEENTVKKTIELIKCELEKNGVSYMLLEEMEGASILSVPTKIRNGKTIRIHFIATDNNNDISVRILGLVENLVNRNHSLAIVNECNSEFRHFKFIYDDSQIHIYYDFFNRTSDSTIGAECTELILRFTAMIDSIMNRLITFKEN